ncbi:MULTISPECIES: hypothetical protein [Cupriavidus]
MMPNLHFTAVHVRTFLGLGRTELQRWLGALRPFCEAQTAPRTARQFSIVDLAFFKIVAELHLVLGLPLRTIAEFSPGLYQYIDAPVNLNSSPERFFLNHEDGKAWAVSLDAAGAMSLAIDPAPIWDSVCQFVGLSFPAQRELALGFVSLPQQSYGGQARGPRAR